MYALYLLGTITSLYYIFTRIRRLLFISSSSSFKDLNIKNQEIDYIDIVYNDDIREVKEYETFNFIKDENDIKYVCVNYYTDKLNKVLFDSNQLGKLSNLTFPFYEEIIKMPLYREIESAIVFANDIEYDITGYLQDFSGPKLNYHQDITDIYFEQIIDFNNEYPELKDAKGKVVIKDNFGVSHNFNYPGKLVWNENILLTLD